jgi:hypothetical protein
MLRSLTNTRAIPLFLFLLFGALYLSTARGVVFCNDGSQMALVRALGEKQSFAINSFVEYTHRIDYAFRDGNYFSDRSVGTSLLALPFYLFTQKTLTALGVPPAEAAKDAQASAVLSICLYGALGVSLLYLLLNSLGISIRYSLVTALLYGGASLHWKYSALFMSHGPSATTTILLLWLLFKPAPERLGTLIFFILGCLPLIRIEAALLIPFFLWIWCARAEGNWRYGKFKSLHALLIAGLWGALPLLFLSYYNTTCFGGPFTSFNRFYAPDRNFFGTEPVFRKAGGAFSYADVIGYSLRPGLRKVLFQFPGRNDLSEDEQAVVGTGSWGVFVLHPVLLLSILGARSLLRKFKNEGFALCAMLVTVTIFVASLRVQDGGGMRDPRFILMALPIFYILLAFAADNFLWHANTIRAAIIQAAFWIASTLSVIINVVHFIDSDEKRPFFNFHDIQASSLVSKEFLLAIGERLFLREMDLFSGTIIALGAGCAVCALLFISPYLHRAVRYGIPSLLCTLLLVLNYSSLTSHKTRVEDGTIEISGHVASHAVQEVGFPRRVVATSTTSIVSCRNALIVQPHSLVVIPLMSKASHFITSVKVKRMAGQQGRARVRFIIRGNGNKILWQSSRMGTADFAQLIALPVPTAQSIALEVTRARGKVPIEALWCNPRIFNK